MDSAVIEFPFPFPSGGDLLGFVVVVVEEDDAFAVGLCLTCGAGKMFLLSIASTVR